MGRNLLGYSFPVVRSVYALCVVLPKDTLTTQCHNINRFGLYHEHITTQFARSYRTAIKIVWFGRKVVVADTSAYYLVMLIA